MQVRLTDGTVSDVDPADARRLVREGNAQHVEVEPEPVEDLDEPRRSRKTP